MSNIRADEIIYNILKQVKSLAQTYAIATCSLDEGIPVRKKKH